MRIRLPDHLACCRCGGSVVLLDLRADRYFVMNGAGGAALITAVESGAIDPERGASQALFARGMLLPEDGPDAPRSDADARPATTDILRGNDTLPLVAGDVARALWLQMRWAAMLRRKRPADLLARLEASARRFQTARDARATARRIANAFARSAVVVAPADRCLARSFAMMAMSHAHGLRPTLYFGVAVEPFAAHAWVQLDDAVMTSDLDEVRQFTPILARS